MLLGFSTVLTQQLPSSRCAINTEFPPSYTWSALQMLPGVCVDRAPGVTALASSHAAGAVTARIGTNEVLSP